MILQCILFVTAFANCCSKDVDDEGLLETREKSTNGWPIFGFGRKKIKTESCKEELLSEMKEMVKTHAETIGGYEQEVAEAKKEIETWKDAYAHLQKDNAKNSKIINVLQDRFEEIRTLKEANADLQKKYTENSKIINDLQERLEGKRETIRGYDQNLRDAEDKNAEDTRIIANLERELGEKTKMIEEAEVEEHLKTIKSLESELEKKEERIRRTKDEVDLARNEIMSEVHQQFQEEIQKLKEEIGGKDLQIEEYEKKDVELLQMVQDSDEREYNAKRECGRLREQLNVLRQESNDLREQLDHPQDCPICGEQMCPNDANPIVTACNNSINHRFHRRCIREWENRGQGCPCCRGPLHIRR